MVGMFLAVGCAGCFWRGSPMCGYCYAKHFEAIDNEDDTNLKPDERYKETTTWTSSSASSPR